MSTKQRIWDRIKRLEFEHIMPFLLVALVYLPYSNTFQSPFIFDDIVAVQYNPDNGRLFTESISTRYFVDLTFRLNYLADGLNLAGYHLVNLLIHALAGVFFYYCLYYLFCLPVFIAWSRRWLRIMLAFFAAAIWLVHPLNTGAVTYICQRYESLMGMMYLLSLSLFIKGCVSARPLLWYRLCLAASMLTMLTKEVAVSLPFVIILLDYVLVTGSVRGILTCRWKMHAAYIATLGVFVVMFIASVSRRNITSSATFTEYTSWNYLYTQLQVITHYLRLTFWPAGQCLDYNRSAVASFTECWRHAIFIGGLFGVGLVGIITRKSYGLLVLCFFMILAPTSSIVPLGDMMFEHRMYLPLTCVVALVVPGTWWALSVMVKDIRARVMLYCCMACGAVILLSIATYDRNEVYRTEVAVWENVLKTAPSNVRAMNNLAIAYIKAKQFSAAELICMRSIDTIMNYRATNKSGIMRVVMSDDYLATAYNKLGMAQLCMERIPSAVSNLSYAVSLVPESVMVRQDYAVALYFNKDEAGAERETGIVLTEDPLHVPARAFYGYLLTSQGRYAEAISQYRWGLRSDKNNLAINLELSMLLSACPQESLRSPGEAIDRTRMVMRSVVEPSVKSFDVLAAAHAANGDYQLAVSNAESALAILRERRRVIEGGDTAFFAGLVSDAEAIADIEAKIKLYKNKQPYLLPIEP